MKSIKENIAKISRYLSIFIVLLMIMNFSQEDIFSKWDTNNNEKISESEFEQHFVDEFYTSWNIDSDGHLDVEDFYTVTFNILDADDDDHLDAAETDWGYDYLYGDYVNYDYMVQETEEGGAMDYDRYRDMIGKTDFYTDYDLDGDTYLSEHELASAVFESWDLNDNGTLDSREFDIFDNYYFAVTS